MKYGRLFLGLALVALLRPGGYAAAEREGSAEIELPSVVEQLVNDACLDCHSTGDATADVDLEAALFEPMDRKWETWERVVRKLHARQMPPPEMPRPDDATYHAVLRRLEQSLDEIVRQNPRPGRTATFRRLTRTEYRYAIRDLLALEIDGDALLPKDEASHEFDNVGTSELSPALLNRYLSAAEEISRAALGRVGRVPDGRTIRVRPDITQDAHMPGLPLGTRGGLLIAHHFPQTGNYAIQVRLTRDRNEHVEGLSEKHELHVLLDRATVATFTVQPPKDRRDHSQVDAHLKARIHVPAGPHPLGVTFADKGRWLLETMRRPYQAHYNMHRHPRLNPAIFEVSITGPFDPSGPGSTPSRQKIFVCQPKDAQDEERCARIILQNLARRAWRRPIHDEELAAPLALFHQGREDGGFEAGIELALASILVNPQFIFRIERDPPGAAPGTVYRVNDVELASRLSFFLWSSIPDDRLLDAATAGTLSRPAELEQQVRRMLDDSKADALVTNFAGQWLYLRNLDSIHPNMRLFPDFDHNLRESMRRETVLAFERVMREDRSVLDLLRSDHTYLNERLATHYGIPYVQGSRFRPVTLSDDTPRGGLLRQASILTVTSYATRTSPVVRGHWILKNLLGTPPPPPPPNVPALTDNTVSAQLTLRERLAQHRADPNCASCHNLMDPVGLALENFDAVGRWRELEAEHPVDATGGLPDGTECHGVAELEEGLLKQPDVFVHTLIEKMLTYALGRSLSYEDGPAVRRIVRDAQKEDYRFSAIVLGIVNSTPFQMRMVR